MPRIWSGRPSPERIVNEPRGTGVLKILAISPGGLGPHYHGPGIALYRLLRRRPDVVTVDILHGSPRQTELSDLPGSDHRLGTIRGLGWPSMLFVFRACWYLLRHRRQYDVVLTSMVNLLTLVPATFAHWLGLPVMLRVAAIEEISTGSGGGAGRRLKRWMIRQASGHLAISGAIAQELHAVLGSDRTIVLLPNSVDTQRFAPVTRAAAAREARDLGILQPEGMVVLCVGAIGRRKGQIFIIEALAALPTSISVLLVGPIQDQQGWAAITAAIDRHGLQNRVTHLPFMDDIERAYRAAQVFVLPSDGEGMPNAMLEAMSSGLVPLGTRISGIEDLITMGCGQFITRDAGAIAAALRDLHANPEKLAHQQTEARDIILRAYDADIIAHRMLETLRHLGKDI